MSRTADSAAKFGFDKFELDVRSGELRTDGKPVKLQLQPFKVLAFLVARAGQVVTREEICQHVWGGETFVDYEQGLNYCIRQIRAALGEDANELRYIETCPRRGYRFLLPVVELLPAKAPSESEPEPSIAVLPFANLSTDKENEYFSDGLAEEIMNALTRVQGLKVIARSSAPFPSMAALRTCARSVRHSMPASFSKAAFGAPAAASASAYSSSTPAMAIISGPTASTAR
jgi:DNA-binding winged helix-turn-helix (wHTH) protein